MTAYYNEIEPFAAQWLRNLIAAGHIAPGDVDERSIVAIPAHDLKDYTQCHFFAGIGGWSLALRLAGWPDERPVWTGSCPCQPLSSAGQRKGHADERHLWPAFHRLISECRPATIFGEQVAGKDGFEWLAGVRADLEDAGYACGAADLCAAGAGAPHLRQRLFWVAHSDEGRRGQGWAREADDGTALRTSGGPSADAVALGNGASARLEGQRSVHSPSRAGRCGQPGPSVQTDIAEWNGAVVVAECTDGLRRVAAEPALFPVAARVPGDVGRLRGSGNAIVPQVAAQFIGAVMECRP